MFSLAYNVNNLARRHNLGRKLVENRWLRPAGSRQGLKHEGGLRERGVQRGFSGIHRDADGFHPSQPDWCYARTQYDGVLGICASMYVCVCVALCTIFPYIGARPLATCKYTHVSLAMQFVYAHVASRCCEKKGTLAGLGITKDLILYAQFLRQILSPQNCCCTLSLDLSFAPADLWCEKIKHGYL